MAEVGGVLPSELQRLRRALPRRLRRDAREVANACFDVLAGDPVGELEGWKAAVEWSADRGALLATGDLPAVFWAALRRDAPEGANLDDPLVLYQQIRSSASCTELARFASGRAFLELRDRLGLAGGLAVHAALEDAPSDTVVSVAPEDETQA